MAEIVVVGAGVIGLTTATALEERGHHVRVIGAATGPDITSSVAGAIWFPFKAEPRERVSRWASVSRRWLIDVASERREAGVDALRAIQLDDSDQTPWWGEGIEDLRLLRDGYPGDAPFAWSFTAPRVDPLIHLHWLESRLKRGIVRRRLASIAEAFEPAAGDTPPDVVVNCSGLESQRLQHDGRMRPLYGQVVVVAPTGIDLSVTIADERDEHAFFYVIPRRTEVVIGGCTREWDGPGPDGTLPPPDPAIRLQILERAAGYGIKPVKVLRDVAGLRPYRDAVRVERDATDPRVIHNYGHGGSGYTIARGCAEEVASLIADG